MKKDLIIIRHGRSRFNVHETDDLDSELTDFGRHQAAVVGKFLAKERLHKYRFFTSPFLRCLQTSEIICPHTNKPDVMIGLREYLNDFSEVHVPYRKEFGFRPCWKPQTFRPEPHDKYMERMHNAYLSLPDKCVVITHGLPMLTLTEIAQGNLNYIPVWDYSVNNCSITRIVNGRVVWRGRNLHHEV